MGFFSRLFGGRDEGDAEAQEQAPKGLSSQAARLKKKVTNKYGQPQDRQRAIQALGEMGTAEACSVLLQRFTFRIEQTIGDEEEKRMVFEELVRLGQVSIAPILEFLATENAPYWPVRVLAEIVGEVLTVTHLIEIIDKTDAVFDRDIQRKVELVSNLREFQDPRVREKLFSMVNDENEDMKVQALLGLAAFGQEEMAPVLVDRILDEAESQRVRTEVLNLLIEKKWKIKRRREEVRKVMPQTFWIDDVGVIHRR